MLYPQIGQVIADQLASLGLKPSAIRQSLTDKLIEIRTLCKPLTWNIAQSNPCFEVFRLGENIYSLVKSQIEAICYSIFKVEFDALSSSNEHNTLGINHNGA